mgnify:FL=1
MSNVDLDRIELKIDKLSVEVDKLHLTIEKLNNKLEQHIGFIDSTYQGLRNPIEAAKRFLGK